MSFALSSEHPINNFVILNRIRIVNTPLITLCYVKSHPYNVDYKHIFSLSLIRNVLFFFIICFVLLSSRYHEMSKELKNTKANRTREGHSNGTKHV